MSFITERQIKPSNINGNRHDTREPNIDAKKVGPSLSDVRKPNLDPSKVEKLLEETKASLLKEKEKLEEQKNSNKKNGFR
jgi:hypothetical protein